MANVEPGASCATACSVAAMAFLRQVHAEARRGDDRRRIVLIRERDVK
jgi:hypothetical protein